MEINKICPIRMLKSEQNLEYAMTSKVLLDCMCLKEKCMWYGEGEEDCAINAMAGYLFEIERNMP